LKELDYKINTFDKAIKTEGMTEDKAMQHIQMLKKDADRYLNRNKGLFGGLLGKDNAVKTLQTRLNSYETNHTTAHEKIDSVDSFCDKFTQIEGQDKNEVFYQVLAKECENRFNEGRFNQSSLGGVFGDMMSIADAEVMTFLEPKANELNTQGYDLIKGKISPKFKAFLESFSKIDPCVKEFVTRTKGTSRMKDRLTVCPDGFDLVGDTVEEAKTNFIQKLKESFSPEFDSLDFNSTDVLTAQINTCVDKQDHGISSQKREALEICRDFIKPSSKQKQLRYTFDLEVDAYLQFKKGKIGTESLIEGLSEIKDIDQTVALDYVFGYQEREYDYQEHGMMDSSFKPALLQDKKWKKFTEVWGQFIEGINDHSTMEPSVKAYATERAKKYLESAKTAREKEIGMSKLEKEQQVKDRVSLKRVERYTVKARLTRLERCFRGTSNFIEKTFFADRYAKRKIMKLKNTIAEFALGIAKKERPPRADELLDALDHIEDEVKRYGEENPKIKDFLEEEGQKLKEEVRTLIEKDGYAIKMREITQVGDNSHITFNNGAELVITDQFAQGGEGVIHHGVLKHEEKEEPVVVKKVLLGWHEYTIGVDANNSLREAISAASIAPHPNILPIYSSSIVLEGAEGEEMDKLILVMPQAKGDAESLVKDMHKAPLEERSTQVIDFAKPVLRGLAHMHQEGLVHRDIKPGNIMIDLDGKLRIADFGITCRSDDTEALTSLEGSTNYMSPEHMTAHETKKQYSSKADIFALGVMMFQCVTGDSLYEAAHPMEDMNTVEDWGIKAFHKTIDLDTMNRVMKHPKLAGLDMKTVEVIKLCLNPDPAARYSADQLLNILDLTR
jgi:serine/threonine protein kinase